MTDTYKVKKAHKKKAYSKTIDIITFFPVVHLMLIGTSVLCNKSQILISITTA
jgi:hypothetical protein